MVKLLIGVLVFLAGIASSTQGLYNGYWKEQLDLKTILFVNSLVVFTFVALFYLFNSDEGIKLSLDKMSFSILIGGACGFFIIMTMAISFPAIGAVASSLIFIVAFLMTSLFYDHIGALNLIQKPINFERVVGVLLVVIGTFLALNSPK